MRVLTVEIFKLRIDQVCWTNGCDRWKRENRLGNYRISILSKQWNNCNIWREDGKFNLVFYMDMQVGHVHRFTSNKRVISGDTSGVIYHYILVEYMAADEIMVLCWCHSCHELGLNKLSFKKVVNRGFCCYLGGNLLMQLFLTLFTLDFSVL